jgi:antitoxin component YwqK of YwqJK toxin-antitoxin module
MVKYLLTIWVLLLSFTGFPQSSETYQGETVNQRDANNQKQGVWVSVSPAGMLEEKGQYTNNKKEGLWYGYYPSGKLKHEITYKNNRPDGPAKFYYPDGKVSEQGIWKINKWVGEYKYYHENGSLAYDWSYNETGQRTGEQRYYYSDGSLMIKGDWTDGKKQGILTEYHPDGSIKAEMNFTDGKIEVASIKEFEIAEKPAKKQTAPKLQPVTNDKASGKELDFFTQTGYYVTYNEFKKVDREGDFVKGKFINGKRYLYNDQGELIRTLVYKDGKVIESVEH